jgi:hypothetical protein
MKWVGVAAIVASTIGESGSGVNGIEALQLGKCLRLLDLGMLAGLSAAANATGVYNSTYLRVQKGNVGLDNGGTGGPALASILFHSF